MSRFFKIFFVMMFLIGETFVFAGDIYHCPMHHQVQSDKPGNCYICGMTLVKIDNKEQDSKVDAHAVSISKDQMQLMGIRTVPIKKEVLVKTVRAAGYISSSHELYQMQDAYIQSYLKYVDVYRDIKRYAHARRNLEPYRKLQLELHESEEQLLRLGLGHAQIAQLQKISWATPWKQPELLLFKEDFQYWVVAQIFENDLGFVDVGQEVDIEIPAYLEHVKGVIRSVGGVLDPGTRTANILIELKNYQGELKANMLVNVSIPSDLNEGLVVPNTAVMDTGVRKIVYVEKSDGVFEARAIEVSAPGDQGWMVKSGLNEGEKVVVDGNFLLDSESRLQNTIGEQAHD